MGSSESARSDSLIDQAEQLIEFLEAETLNPSLQIQSFDLAVACHGRMLELEHLDQLEAIHHAVAGARLIQALRHHIASLPDWLDIHEEQLCRYGGMWIQQRLQKAPTDPDAAKLGQSGLEVLQRLNLIHGGTEDWIGQHLSFLQQFLAPRPEAPTANPTAGTAPELTIAMVGNCQAWPLLLDLRQLLPSVKFHHCPSVHLATPEEVKEFQQLLTSADVLLTHRIQPGYRNDIGLDNQTLIRLLAPESRPMVLPNLHYEGHHPWIGYANDPEGLLAPLEQSSPLGPYHDFLAMAAARRGLSARDLLARALPSELAHQIRKFHQNSLEQLRQREADCAVEISSWIDDHHRHLPIVHSINHPTHACMRQLLLRLLAALNLQPEVDPTSLKVQEHLGELSIPILPWVREALGLEAWTETWGHRHHDQPFNISDQLEASIAFYLEHPWIFALNQHLGKAQFAESALNQLLSHPVAPPLRSPSVAALINYFDDIDMLRWQVRGDFLEDYDRIYIWDGPYNYLASISFFPQQPRRLDETELGRELLADPRVVYHYQEWKGEAEKRIAAYEATKEDLVVLHDTDEFSIIGDNHYQSFWHSDYEVASNLMQNLYLSGLYCTYDAEASPLIENLPQKRVVFKRAKVSAEDHLDFLWLVGVEQKKVHHYRIDPRPLAHAYHLTACRSPLGQEAKMSFYTALSFCDKPLSWVIEKLAELVQKGLLSETQARRIFLLGDPGYAGIPNPDFGLIVHHRIVDPNFPNNILDPILTERNRVGFGNYLLLQGYPVCLWLEATVEEMVITLGQSAKLTVRTWDWINGSKAQDRPTLTTESAVIRIQFPSQTSDLHGRLVKLAVESNPSLPPLLAVKISGPEA